MSNRKGFTLIELIIVVIIVGILAAVTVPMMRGNILRAQRSEAVAAIGTIRTAERMYFAENSAYVTVASTDWANGNGNLSKYISPGDLNGKYYNQGNYSADGSANTATATISGNNNGNANINLVTGTINEVF